MKPAKKTVPMKRFKKGDITKIAGGDMPTTYYPKKRI